MNFDERYAGVPEEQREALRRFREDYPAREISHDGTTWTCLRGGSGPALLWLVGGLRRADAAFQSIPLLSEHFTIIAPDYPALPDFDALADGLAALLDAENVEKAHVLAGSWGGMLAQVFMRRHPDRVDRVVLSTTTPPMPGGAERYSQMLSLVQGLDAATVALGAKQQFMEIISPPALEHDFYRAYLGELFDERIDRDEIMTTYSSIIDYMDRELSPAPENIPVLIIEAEDDATFGPETRQAMRVLYPQARIFTFRSAGHSPASTHRDRYFALVRDFLQDRPIDS